MEKKKTVYIVEDSRVLSGIIALQLKHAFNCDTVIFNNGDDVIDQIKQEEPDLIILDYNFNENDLKYSNGLEFLIALRKKYNTPVIVFSGQKDKTTLANIILNGANDYINKENDDFMSDLILSAKDIFDLQNAKKDIHTFTSRLKKLILLFIVLIVVGVTVIRCSV